MSFSPATEFSLRLASSSSTTISSIQPHKFHYNLPFRNLPFNLTTQTNSKRLFSTYSSMAGIGSSADSSAMEEQNENGAINPVYTPTPPYRELRTPHSGYISSFLNLGFS